MVDRTLADFVKEALARGAARPDIERALTAAGWPADQAKSALAAYAEVPFVTPVPLPKPYVSAREAFLYLLLFILLGIAAGHLGGLLFVLVDVFMPRDTPDIYSIGRASGAIRWSVSALAVALPVYLVLAWRLAKARRRNPAMQGSRIRKWLTYITLVFAAGTLIGDLIAVLYSFLAGELTPRFLLKAAVIALIAGAVFIYYVQDAEKDEDAPPAPALGYAIGGVASLIAVAASIAGVSVIDSPATVRAYERDETRMNALAEVAGTVDCYYTYEGRTPSDLAEMRGALEERASTTPIEYSGCTLYEQLDPATAAPYEYRALAGAEYELCATFDRESRDFGQPPTRTYSYGMRGGYRTMSAVHGEGRHCFTLTAESLEEDAAAR